MLLFQSGRAPLQPEPDPWPPGGDLFASSEGGGSPPPTIVMPATATRSVAALAPTFDIANEVWTGAVVGSVIAPVQAGGTVVYTLVGAQADGFGVENVGGAAQIKVYDRQRMLDNGVRLQLLKQRSFTLRATVGAASADCAVTINLDTAAYNKTCPLPGLDAAVGRTSTNPLIPIASKTGLVGWSVDTVNKIVSATANNPTPLIDIDFTGYRLLNTANYTGVSFDQCLFRPTPSLVTAAVVSGHAALLRSDYAATISNCTIDLDPDNVKRGWNGVQGIWTGSNVAVLGAQNDGSNAMGQWTNCYLSTSGQNKYSQIDLSPLSDYNKWGHCDGVQTWSTSLQTTFDNHLIFDSPQPYVDGPNVVRNPAGTASFVNGSAVVSGAGTSWLNGNANDRLNVGEVIRVKGGVNSVVVSVDADDRVTIGNAYGGTTTTAQLKAFAFDDARAGVTSPVYIHGVTNANPGGVSGTATFTAGSASVVGTGTTFNTLKPGDILNNGFELYTVQSVADATHLTLTANASTTRTNIGPLSGGTPLSFDLIVQNSVALGGTYPFQSRSFAVDGAPTNARILWKNLAIGDYLYGTLKVDTTLATTATVQGCKDFYSGAAVADLRPVPVAPTVTQGATGKTYLTLAYASQDSSIEYEYRQRTTAGPGAWSGWTPVPSNKRIAGLSASTSYDFEVRGKNCVATDGTYLQVGPAASVTFATNAGTAYDAMTSAWIGSFSTAEADAYTDALDQLVVALKAAGITGSLDYLRSYVTAVEANAYKNGLAPGAFDAVSIGAPGPVFTPGQGFANWGGGKYLKAGYFGSFTGGNKASQNSRSLFFYRRDNGTAANHALGGNSQHWIGGRQFSVGAGPFSRDGSTTTDQSNAVSRSDGLWLVNRSASGAYEVYGNGSANAPDGTAATFGLLNTIARASAAGPNSEYITGGFNSTAGSITQGTVPNTGTQIVFEGAGAGLTSSQAQALYAAIYAFLKTLGVVA